MHFYVVPSRNDFNLSSAGKTFTQYPAYERENVLNFNGIVQYLNRTGGIILANNGGRDVTITVRLMFYSHPSFFNIFKNENISSYNIQGVNCVVLDATAGVYGYPGFNGGLVGQKIAIDPITKEYYYLQ